MESKTIKNVLKDILTGAHLINEQLDEFNKGLIKFEKLESQLRVLSGFMRVNVSILFESLSQSALEVKIKPKDVKKGLENEDK